MGLKNNGMIIVKENVTSSVEPEVDKQDSSCTRPCNDLEKIFHSVGLICVKKKLQNRMPQGLYPIYMFALKPREYVQLQDESTKNVEPCEKEL